MTRPVDLDAALRVADDLGGHLAGVHPTLREAADTIRALVREVSAARTPDPDAVQRVEAALVETDLFYDPLCGADCDHCKRRMREAAEVAVAAMTPEGERP